MHLPVMDTEIHLHGTYIKINGMDAYNEDRIDTECNSTFFLDILRTHKNLR